MRGDSDSPRAMGDGTFHYSLLRHVEAGSLSLPTAGRQAQGPVAPPALDGTPDILNLGIFHAPGNLTENFAQYAKHFSFAKSVIEDVKAGRREKLAEK